MSFTGHAMPDQVKEIVICVMGIAGGIGSYVVGSSISSRNKDKALNDALNNNQNQQP
jgi:tRNA A37 threonylcarbamoyladenosine dehydratase